MPDGLQEVGVRLVADNQVGFAQGMMGAGQQVDQFAQRGREMAASTQTANTWATALAVTGGTLLANGMMAAANAVRQGVQEIQNLGNEALMAAGRLNEMNLVAEMMGAKMGKTKETVDAEILSIRGVGIEANKAADAYVQFYKNSLDLAKASELAKVAQDAAVLGGIDSSSAFDRLIYGITTQQREVLKTIGIQVNADQAYQKFAETLKVNVKTLDSDQKAQAFLNAVLSEGTKIAGAYEVAMGSATKQLRTMQGRVIPDLMAALGGPFQEAFYNVVKGENEMLTTITALVTPTNELTADMKKLGINSDNLGGKLVPLFKELGAIAAVAGEGFRDFGKKAVAGMADFAVQATDVLSGVANNALTWGSNIVTQLAAGIIEGASTVLVSAMNFVGSILSYWMAPGSPPKIAPKVDLWGTATAEEWMKGFTSADFSMLQNMSGPIQNALQQMVKGGSISASEGAGRLTFIQDLLTKSVGSGISTPAVIKAITDQLGAYGAKIKTVLEDQLKLVDAIHKMQDAQTKFNKTSGEEMRASDTASAAAREYNKLVESGAKPELIAAAKAKLDIAMKEQKSIKERRLDQEKILKNAKAEVALLTPGQQQKLAKVPKTPKEKTGKGGAGGGGTPNPFKDVGETMKTAADTAFEALKSNVRAKLDEVWTNITNTPAFQKALTAWDTLGKKWGEFTGTVEKFYNERLKGPFTALGDLAMKIFPPEFINNMGKVLGFAVPIAIAFGAISIAWAIFGAIAAAPLTPVILIGLGIALIVTHAQAAFKAITDLGGYIKLVLYSGVVHLVEGFLTARGAVIDLYNSAILLGQQFGAFKDVKLIPNDTIALIDQVWKRMGEIADDTLKADKQTNKNITDNFSGLDATTKKVQEFGPPAQTAAQALQNMALGAKDSASQLQNITTANVGPAFGDIAKSTDTLKASMDNLAPSIKASMDQLAAAPVDITPKATAALDTIATNINAKSTDIKSAWTQTWEGFTSASDSAWTNVMSKFRAFIDQLIQQLKDSLPRFAGIGKSIVDQVSGAVSSGGTGMKNVGIALIKGVEQGISSESSNLYKLIMDVVKKAVATAQGAAESNSPSKLSERKVGLPIAQGIAVGLAKGGKEVDRAAYMLTMRAVSPPASPTAIRDRAALQQVINNSYGISAQNMNFNVPQQSQLADFMYSLASNRV